MSSWVPVKGRLSGSLAISTPKAMKTAKLWTRVAPGIYRYKTGTLYERPVINGRPTWRKLTADGLKLAKQELAAKRTDQTRARLGLAVDPYQGGEKTVGELCQDYLRAGCPDRQRRPKAGTQLDQERSRLNILLEWWASIRPGELNIGRCDAYADFRMGQVLESRGTTGARAVDLELNTLHNAFKHAVRSGQLRFDPLAFERPAYCASGQVRHCRDCAPKSGDELHAHARFFFERPETEVLGWQLLFEALTGCRTSEALSLRMDAADQGEPGFIADGVLWLARAKGGCNNFLRIHDALANCLRNFAVWRRRRFDDGGAVGWWFPRSDGQKLENNALSRGLKHSAVSVCQGEPRTSHGLRSFYVTVRRCQGANDGQIAIELGQRTGPSLITKVYGDSVPGKLDWLPANNSEAPSWERRFPELVSESRAN